MVVFSEKLGVNKKKARMNLHSGFLSFRDEIDTYSLSEPVGRGPPRKFALQSFVGRRRNDGAV